MSLFESFKKLFSDLGEGEEQAGRFGEADYRVAAAALLVHTATVDGVLADSENVKLHAVLRQRFDLDDGEVDELVAAATAAEQKSIDLYQFTVRLNRSFDHEARARMIEMMWQVVYADGTVTEFEDNLIWRAADLLHVTREERIALRDRVAAARLSEKESGTP